jgi:thioredoxin-like negative regulator of GroEL
VGSIARVGCVLLAASSVAGAAPAATPEGAPTALTVFVDFVVEDAKGRPALNLTAEEVVVVQDGARQRVASLEPRGAPGQYELSYVPASGKAGALAMQLMRPGTRARGLTGPTLKPRVVLPPSPVASELLQILAARPEADDFRALLSVLRFEAAPDGLHHTFAVEVPMAGVIPVSKGGQYTGRVQIFARLGDADGREVQRYEVDRSVSAATTTQLQVQRLVWTGQVHLRNGRYVLEVVVRDPETGRASVRRRSFDVLQPEPGLRMSSVTFLHPLDSLMVREVGREADDPFLLSGEPVMPTLELETAAAPGAKVEFFSILYRDERNPDPVTLKLELMRDGDVVGSAPLTVPQPNDRGEIRYAGAMGTRTLRPGEYVLRLLAFQGTLGVLEEAPFKVLGENRPPVARVEGATEGKPAPSSARPAAPAPPDLPELVQARGLVQAQRYEQAIDLLKKADKSAEGRRADVALMLAIAYYRSGAFKDAETTARRAIDLTESPTVLADAQTLLGRALAEGEKGRVRKDSERLRAAEQAFRKALVLSEGRSEAAQLALAETLYRLDRAEEGRTLLGELLEKPDATEPAAARARQIIKSPRCAMEPCLPELSFVTSEGRHLTPEDLRGSVVVLSFWATWCEPCVTAVPDLKKLYGRYADGPFVMVGINADSDPAVAERFVEKHRMRWAQVTGESAERVLAALSVHAFPTEMVFDHEGVLVDQTRGWSSATGRALADRIGDAIATARKASKQAPVATQ